jgi:hypothetical protein
MSPYIVTTKYPHDRPALMGSIPRRESRRAVATLEEAHEHVSDIIDAHGSGGRAWAWHESGGTVGPLPDGTLIEVEAVKWSDSEAQRRILDAYNARQS